MITVLCANIGLDKTYEVDRYDLGAFHHPRRVLTAPGGKGVNVARVIRSLGHEVTLTGFCGGHMGQYISSFLRREFIIPEFISIAEEPRFCINVIDKLRGTQTRLDEVGPLVTPSEVERLQARWREFISASKLVIISGSAPRGVPFDLYHDLIAEAKAKKVVTILDAHDELMAEGIKAGPSVIKPNWGELCQLMGRELSVPEGVIGACRELINDHVAMVICSLGQEGAIVATPRHGEWWVRAPQVEVISPVGSGDAMVGTFAVASIERMPLVDRIKWAVAAGSACAANMAAGVSSREEIEALVEHIEVEDLSALASKDEPIA